MHGLLLELVVFVELPLLEHLLCRLERIPGRVFDETHLSVLSAIALRSFEVEDESSALTTTVFPLQERILLHLWEVMLPALDVHDVQEQVLEQIPAILRQTAPASADGDPSVHAETSGSASSTGLMAGKLLEDCVANISRRVKVPISLQLLTQIAQLVMEGCVAMARRPDPSGSYVQVILNELAAFKRETKRNLEMDCCVRTGMSDEELRALPPLTGYLERVKAELFALKGAWVLDCSEGATTSFGQDQANELWGLLVSHAVVTDEASLCFQWVKFCLKSPPFGQSAAELIPFEVAQYLLTSRFHTLSGEAITMSALSCFQALFNAVNVAKGELQTFLLEPPTDENVSTVGAADTTVDLVASPRDLVGLDELWHLTMHAADPRVAEECVMQLVGCYLDVVPSLRGTERLLQSKRDLVERCMDHLRSAKAKQTIAYGTEQHVSTSDAASCRDRRDDATNIVDRCLDLFRYFLEACKSQDDEAGGHDEFDGGGGGSSDAVRSGCRREYVIDSLEESLPFLDVYPSPMKDSAASFTEQSVFGTARRPSWTFRQQHRPLLDSIIDERDDKEEGIDDVSDYQRDPTAQSLSFGHEGLGVSIPPVSCYDSSSLRSPSLRPRANLMQPPSPSPQRGPVLSVDDIGLILVEQDEVDQRGDQAEVQQGPGKHQAGIRPRARTWSSKYDGMSHLLANEGTYFQTLLELVDSGEPATARRTWELLCLLPTNNALLRTMIQLRSVESGAVGANQVDWDDLLSSSRVYRLVYALRLVEALLIPLEADAVTSSDAGGSTDVARRQWRERFVRLGGARHVYDVLLEWTRQPGDDSGTNASPERLYLQNLRATCLAGMIRTVDYFLKLAHSSSRGQTQRGSRSEFDTRLVRSTLPAFLDSIDVPALFHAVVELTIAAYSRHDKTSELSDEVEESVLAGVEVCCSLIQLEPARVLQSVGVDSTTSQPIRIRDWLKALLVDCPRATTRENAMASLVRLSDSAAGASGGSAVQRFVDMMRDAGCAAMIRATTTRCEKANACEQLLTLCCSLFRRCARDPFLNEAETAATTVDSLLTNLCAHVADTRPAGSHAPGSLMELLTAMAHSSATVRSIMLHWRPTARQHAALTTMSAGDGEWALGFLMDRFIFAGSESGELHQARSPRVLPSAQDRSRAQKLALGLLFPDKQSQGSQPLLVAIGAAINSVLARQERFHVAVAQEVDRMGRPWNYSPRDSLQSGAGGIGRAGLVNPGCVCYMNALLQQLFMMPGFFSGLLELDCSDSDAPLPTQKVAQWHEEVRELQRLFAALGYTAKRSCDPTAFALSHRDLDGNPTDLRTQMDADEFFCLLLDRLETFIISSSHSSSSEAISTSADAPTASDAAPPTHFLDECFGGVLVNQILTENGHLSEREEGFFALSLEITRKRHLADSLALYVQGEPLDGENAYFCERVQRKVSATKRICVKTLPRTLVCHLKRFEFDFDTMEKVKINDYLEFPMEIDMSPYTSGAAAGAESTTADSAAYEAAGECMYDLVGVVVHSGTSDMGHYYSFIKDRHDGAKGSDGVDDWFEFNDEAVRPFDVEAMGDECFGGEEVRQKWDPAQGAFVPSVETKRRSAYMLIYERRRAPPLGLSPEQRDDVGATIENDPEGFCPDVRALVSDIRLENQRLDGVVHAFGDAYEAFVGSVLRGISSSATGRFGDDEKMLRLAYQCACKYLFGIRALSSRQGSTIAVDGPEGDAESVTVVVDSVCAWLAGYNDNDIESGRECFEDDQRIQFCAWLFDKTTAIMPSADHEDGTSRDECARSWLFDVLFLSESDLELPSGCLQILSVAVETVTRFLGKSEAEAGEFSKHSMLTKLSALVRALLDEVYARHRELIVHEPVCDGAVVIQASKAFSAATAAADVLERIVCVLPGTLGPEEAARSCRSALYHVFVRQVDFVARFLASLETMVDRNMLTSQSNIDRYAHDGVHPSADCHSRILEKEKSIFAELLRWQHELEVTRATGPVGSASSCGVELLSHTDAVLRRAVVKGLVLAGCKDVLSRFAVQITRNGSESECDRILSLLLIVLEDMRSTSHASKVLAVIEAVLERQACTNNGDEDSMRRGRHIVESVFSPAHGILEAAAYYKDRPTDREHAFALLQLVIRTAASSAVLRELFAADPQWQKQLGWLVEWVVRYVDPIGAITRRKRAEDGDVEPCHAEFDGEAHPLPAKDALDLFTQMEAGLDALIFTDREEAADVPEYAEAEEKAAATTKPDGHQTVASYSRKAMDESFGGENQSEPTDATVGWAAGPMARKDARVQQQPEDDEGEGEQSVDDTTAASRRTRVPRLTLDLECTYINYSEA